MSFGMSLVKITLSALCFLVITYWVSFYLLYVPAFLNGLPQSTFYLIADSGKVNEPVRRLRINIAVYMGATADTEYGGATLMETAMRFNDEYAIDKLSVSSVN